MVYIFLFSFTFHLVLQVLGDCCSCVTAHNEQGTNTTLTHLLIRWPSAGDLLNPSRAHRVLVNTLHTSGIVRRILAVNTRVLFLSPLTPTSSLSVPLLHHYDPSKKGRYEIVDNKKFSSSLLELLFTIIHIKYCYIFITCRRYWIADMSWTSDGLLLVCVLKQGSLYGQPMKLITHGCSMDMGPAYFLPLHPLISIV